MDDQFLVNNYNIVQNEYHNLVKDTIKRIDDKFDRIMFYLENFIKKPDYHVNLNPDIKNKNEKGKEHDFIDKKSTEDANISVIKPKKGWVFKMYRM